jgi:S-DNA-T family DNA segregation ATPase FtsK/SpoIIIE
MCTDVVLWGIDLKEGMELAPWRTSLHRLAVNKTDAVALLAAAVTELERRAEYLASQGVREWTPTPRAPALVIVVDEYAELPTAARKYADSIARRGRAVAVTLLVATQRPTQKAMGSGTAIRSQMDVRVCFRVRERGDVDLILGQGMYKAGWDTTGFDAPGKFLLSAPEHRIPRRARAYLITDEQIQYAAALAAADRPRPGIHGQHDGHGGHGGGPRDGREGRDGGEASSGLLDILTPPVGPGSGCGFDSTSSHGAADGGGGEGQASVSGPDVALWSALRQAGRDGVTVAALVAVSGLSRRSVYRRLSSFEQAGRVTRVGNGRWTASTPNDSDSDIHVDDSTEPTEPPGPTG